SFTKTQRTVWIPASGDFRSLRDGRVLTFQGAPEVPVSGAPALEKGGSMSFDRRPFLVAGSCLSLVLISTFAAHAVAATATGVAAFQSCTAYANGAKAVFNNTLYHTIATVPSSRDCPPNSPFNPSNDNWWV